MFLRWHLISILDALLHERTPLWKRTFYMFVFVGKVFLILAGVIVLPPLVISIIGILCQEFIIEPTNAEAGTYSIFAQILLLSSFGGALLCLFTAHRFPRERSDEEILKDDLKHLRGEKN